MQNFSDVDVDDEDFKLGEFDDSSSSEESDDATLSQEDQYVGIHASEFDLQTTMVKGLKRLAGATQSGPEHTPSRKRQKTLHFDNRILQLSDKYAEEPTNKGRKQAATINGPGHGTIHKRQRTLHSDDNIGEPVAKRQRATAGGPR